MGRKRKADHERLSPTERKQTGKNMLARKDGAVMTYHVVPPQAVETSGLSVEDIVRQRLAKKGWEAKELHSAVEQDNGMTFLIIMAVAPHLTTVTEEV